MKKWVKVLLVIVGIFVLGLGWAAYNDIVVHPEVDGIEYVLEDGEYIARGFAKDAVIPEVLEIPAEVMGRPVTIIESLGTNDIVKKVILPDSVKKLYYAFAGFSALTEVEFGDGLEEIGSGSFSGCESLKKINIPDSVKIIGQHAFFNCFSLSKVTLHESLEEISGEAFSLEEEYGEPIVPRNTSLHVEFDGTKAQWESICYGSYLQDVEKIICLDGVIVWEQENNEESQEEDW